MLWMSPHMHLRGKSFRYEARYPDGTSEILLDVPKYDFNWQITYELAEPKPLPKGTQAEMHGPLRQFGKQSRQSRSQRHGQIRTANVARNDDRLVRHALGRGRRLRPRSDFRRRRSTVNKRQAGC